MLYPIYYHRNKKILLIDIMVIIVSVLIRSYIKKPCFDVVIFAITIFLAFSGSFMMALYTNKEINTFWQSKNTLNVFLQSHRNYMGLLTVLLFIMLMLNMLQLNLFKIGLNGVISLITVWLVLSRSWMMFQRYLDTYKNTYSNRIQDNI